MATCGIFCGGCQSAIEDNKHLLCGGCKQYYDLTCANISEQRFYGTMTKDHRDAWRCVLCKSRQPKTDNTNTPVRVLTDGVTLHRGAAATSPMLLDMSVSEQPLSLVDNLNDTAHNATIEMSDIQALVMEVRSFREEVREELRANRTQIKLLNATLTMLSGKITECECRIDSLDNRIAALERTPDNPELSNGSLSASIEQLRAELNDRDQDLLLNDVEVSCIPEQRGESLPHVIVTVASKLGVTLADQDIVSVVRVGRLSESADPPAAAPRPRLIVVRLARRAVRDQLLRAARVRRGATTEGTGLPGSPRRFYVNERLTRVNRHLFRQARELGARMNWRFVWTRDGRIFARQHHGADSPRIRLRTESDLTRVFSSNAVSSN